MNPFMDFICFASVGEFIILACHIRKNVFETKSATTGKNDSFGFVVKGDEMHHCDICVCFPGGVGPALGVDEGGEEDRVWWELGVRGEGVVFVVVFGIDFFQLWGF